MSNIKTCPYLEAKGWHMFVGYHKPDGTPGYACHGCGEWGGSFDEA